MSCSRAFVLAAAASLFIGGHAGANAQTAGGTQRTAQQSAFLGEWELDLTRMPETYGPPPKRVTYTFQDVGSDEWLTRIDITAQDGSARHIAMRYQRDGKAVQGEGDTIDGDSAALNSPAPNILVMTVAKDKHLGSVRVYAVSANGKEMTESAANVDNTGVPFVRNFHFKRVR